MVVLQVPGLNRIFFFNLSFGLQRWNIFHPKAQIKWKHDTFEGSVEFSNFNKISSRIIYAALKQSSFVLLLVSTMLWTLLCSFPTTQIAKNSHELCPLRTSQKGIGKHHCMGIISNLNKILKRKKKKIIYFLTIIRNVGLRLPLLESKTSFCSHHFSNKKWSS